ncbi:hypothetical protein ACFU96_46240 [Streptomyces sp. NPDC057620]|uniref:hypothetical protein n=1 Tax=Streptomyces sp. NPDC057620 TaxID=3346185 RepID=UPI0036874826
MTPQEHEELAAAVAKVGALPVGPGPLPLSDERLAEIAERRSEAVEVSALACWPLAEYKLIQQTLADQAVLLADNERLRSRVAELEAERHSTNEALSDAAEALRARDTEPVKASGEPSVAGLIAQAIRACQPAPLVTPQGCSRCGVPEREHMQRFKDGWHHWIAPTQEQVKARMLARRAARKGGA